MPPPPLLVLLAQVGGLVGGAKLASSAPGLPLRVHTEVVQMPAAASGFVQSLNSHLLLVFTGRARLARNLLQNVVRRWYARLPEIVETTAGLIQNSLDAR